MEGPTNSVLDEYRDTDRGTGPERSQAGTWTRTRRTECGGLKRPIRYGRLCAGEVASVCALGAETCYRRSRLICAIVPWT